MARTVAFNFVRDFSRRTVRDRTVVRSRGFERPFDIEASPSVFWRPRFDSDVSRRATVGLSSISAVSPVSTMTIIAEITLPSATFSLGRAMQAFPDATIELERVVPLQETIMPLLWVEGGDVASIESTLKAHSQVKAVETLTTTASETPQYGRDRPRSPRDSGVLGLPAPLWVPRRPLDVQHLAH